MLERVKKMGWRSVWLLFVAVLIILLIAYAYPEVKAVRLQSKAGNILANYVAQAQQDQAEAVGGIFYCIYPLLHPEMLEGNDLDQAILWLNEAKSIAPRNVYSSFLLGQAYCLKQEYKQAIDVLDGFLTRRPDNQLAKAESGFAYVALGRSISDPQIAKTYRSKGLQSLLEAGYSNNSFTNQGDISFKQEKYQDALVWYEISDSFSGLQNLTLFRYALLQLVLQGFSPYADQINDEMILDLNGDLAIEPTEFFRLSTSSSIEKRSEENQNIGILYSNSDDAAILLNVNQASNFCITVHALDKLPQPIQIGVDVDFKTLSVLELVNGNGVWVQFNLDVHLDPGIHILGIKLMNDSIVGEIDRNAYFGLVTIETCQNE